MSRRFTYFESDFISPYNQFYQVYRDALTLKPTGVYDDELNDLFQTWDDAGFLGVSPSDPTGRKFNHFFLLGNFSPESAIKNMAQPDWDATIVNNPTFIQGNGFQGNSSGYIDCNTDNNPSHQVYLDNDDSCIGIVSSQWTPTNVADGYGATGSTNNGIRMRPIQANDNRTHIAHYHTAYTSWTASDGVLGHHLTIKSGTAHPTAPVNYYQNGVFKQTRTLNVINGILDTIPRLMLSRYRNLTGAVNVCTAGQVVCAVHEGLELNASEIAILTASLKTYFDGIGVASPIP